MENGVGEEEEVEAKAPRKGRKGEQKIERIVSFSQHVD